EFNYNQHRFLTSLRTPSPFPTGSAATSTWRSGDLVGFFLPRDDVRGLYLGEITGCCQHPNSVAKLAAWHGQESPNGGFFVVVDKNNPGKVLAESWSMVSPDGGLLLDSIEGHVSGWRKGETDRRADVMGVYEQMAKDVVKDRFHRVTVAGAGNAGIDGSK